MDALTRRREEDLQRLRNISSLYQQVVRVLEQGPSLSSVKVRLKIPTARDTMYPGTIQESTDIEIAFPQRYPFEEPLVRVLTPVWNPNIFQGGKICLGTRWLATEGLDLLVERVMRILAFEPSIINTHSPAHQGACNWYITARSLYPSAFPSVQVGDLLLKVKKPKILWKREQPVVQWKEI